MGFRAKFGVFFLLALTTLVCVAEKRRAFFSKPVVNLISHKFSDYAGFERFLTTYSPQSKNSCLRTFQGLFGEMVFVDAEQAPSDGYMHVQMCHCLIADRTCAPQPLCYWVKRDDLLFFDQLSQEQLALFPQPIIYGDLASVDVPGVVVLAVPWTSKHAGKRYSVGTRFRTVDSDPNGRYRVLVFFDPETGEQVTEKIPLRLLVNLGVPIPAAKKREAFVKLLKKWCSNKGGVIPYVWGGASSLSRTDENFRLQEKEVNGQGFAYWTRMNGKLEPDGFDCSALVLRAAQACGIPYFCRTAGTAGVLLEQLGAGQSVEIGDFFVTAGGGPNHIFVAIGRNAIIEAAGYTSGFACVHRIAVRDRFVNVQNYAGLVTLFREGIMPVYRCKDDTLVMSKYFVIVKLPVA